MTPMGAISLIFSVVTIIVSWLYRGIKKLATTSYKPTYQGATFSPHTGAIFAAIAVFVVSVILFGYGNLLAQAGDRNNNLALIQDVIYTCDERTPEIGERNVILRLDDVQSYGWTDISIKMMSDAIDRDMFIVAGVIPQNIRKDGRVVRFLKREHCHIEIAMHGYDHNIGQSEDPDTLGEFATLNTEEATQRIRLGFSELSRVTNKSVTTFIPPQNQISAESISALEDEGFLALSSEGDNYFDYDASTWDFSRNERVDAATVIDDCENVFSKERRRVCVIMLHPQDFSNSSMELDKRSYREFEKILTYLQQENITTVRFSDVNEEALGLGALSRDLAIGSSGDDVALLQSLLISANSGPAAEVLADTGPTGYFGNITRDALWEFQRINSVVEVPRGILDSTTRDHLKEWYASRVWLQVASK